MANVEKAAKTGETIKALVELDVAQGSAKVNSSPSRSVSRSKRVVEAVQIFFEQVLEDEYVFPLSFGLKNLESLYAF